MATKKIIIEKEESVGEVIDLILGEPDKKLMVIVPRGSLLEKSARNFKIIQQEAADAGKELEVESPDENIILLAKRAGMAVVRAPNGESGGRVSGMSDIVPVDRHDEIGDDLRGSVSSDEREEEEPASRGGNRRASTPRVRGGVSLKVPDERAGDDDDAEDQGEKKATRNVYRADREQEEASFLREEDRFFKKRNPPPVTDRDDQDTALDRGIRGTWIAWGVVALAVVIGALYGVSVVFGSAKINITFKKMPYSYSGNFIADKSVSAINAATGVIPAQIFSLPKNVTQLFPATGQSNVSVKAQGTVTIYNAYSSSPQPLVATTRFVTPDGKIFRLVSKVVVPGASVKNGTIVPSSINAQVIADQAGASYNIGPTPKLTIPGFQGTPKYNGFYGALTGGTSGGFVGVKAVPTAADIAAAKQKVTDILTSSLQNGLSGGYTSNFKILNGATNIQITNLTVNTSTDQNGQFSVYGEGVLSAIGFDESAFKAFLLSVAQSQEASSTFSDLTLNYTNVVPDFVNGKMTFSVSAQGDLEPAFSPSDFAARIEGASVATAKSDIAALPELQSGTISLWPSWLWKIPTNTKKIQISVD
jgi:hypothetical protein